MSFYFIFILFLNLIWNEVGAVESNSNFEYKAAQYYSSFIRGLEKESFNATSYNLNIYDNKITKVDFSVIENQLIKRNSEFEIKSEAEKSKLVKSNENTYKCTIQLLVTALLNRWYLTEQEEYTNLDIHARNLLLITLETLLNINIDIQIGNITTYELRDIVKILISSLYFDDSFISKSAYDQNEDVLNYPAYSAIGRGYDIPGDYEKYINILKEFKSGGNSVSTPCPYGFDHKLSLILLGVCDYNKFMLENTNKFNLINLYQNAPSSFITSDRYIFSTKNSFQYYNYAGSIILNRHLFSSNYATPKSEDMENIIEELFTPYDIENILYKLHFYNKNILPDNVYYLNELNSMSKNAVSLFNVYSDIVDTISDLVNEDKSKYFIISLVKSLYYNIKEIYYDVNNDNEVDEYNNIVRMYNRLFYYSIIDRGYFEYTEYLFINNFPQYYPNNQLSYELKILSKYYKDAFQIDNTGTLTVPTNQIISYIKENYDYKNIDLYEFDHLSNFNQIPPVQYLIDFSNIINNKIITNYYGDYYSDDLLQYVSIINNFSENYELENIYESDLESSGNSKYKKTGYSFEYINEIIDNRFMVYNLNYLINQTINISPKIAIRQMSHIKNLLNKYSNDAYYLNKLYFMYNVMASTYNTALNEPIYSFKTIHIEELEIYIKNLISNNYKLLYNYKDVTAINHLKYYLYNNNQVSTKKDINLLNIIKQVDEPFVKTFLE